jgi:hypothetical protein
MMRACHRDRFIFYKDPYAKQGYFTLISHLGEPANIGATIGVRNVQYQDRVDSEVYIFPHERYAGATDTRYNGLGAGEIDLFVKARLVHPCLAL